MNLWNEIKNIRCHDCFWNSVTLESWQDFEGSKKSSLPLKTQLDQIKNRKCRECKSGIDNFSENWRCKKCKSIIGGHQKFWHASLCEHCWMNEVSQQSLNNKNEKN